jgi:hypothetical protein
MPWSGATGLHPNPAVDQLPRLPAHALVAPRHGRGPATQTQRDRPDRRLALGRGLHLFRPNHPRCPGRPHPHLCGPLGPPGWSLHGPRPLDGAGRPDVCWLSPAGGLVAEVGPRAVCRGADLESDPWPSARPRPPADPRQFGPKPGPDGHGLRHLDQTHTLPFMAPFSCR